MSRRLLWNKIKRSKGFNVRFYRKLGTLLIFTMLINFGLVIAIFYLHLELPEPDFYSTYGETPPAKLTPMNHPNYSSTALLSDDNILDSDVRIVPQ